MKKKVKIKSILLIIILMLCEEIHFKFELCKRAILYLTKKKKKIVKKIYLLPSNIINRIKFVIETNETEK